ncbi:YozQ family protein [Bacillus marasmi]|uniref:YozQ family protein n=1 Tax=Bacillus marasmi TaxID=1926279 RepID=UPI0011C80CEE|nr:YozQ family protein [Bacillus marasmi]
MKNNMSKDSSKVAGRNYDVSDYQKTDQLSKGLATTHEQVSDTYIEGEIKPKIDHVNERTFEIPNN